MDPWFTPYSAAVKKGIFAIKDISQAVCMLETENYADEVDHKVQGANS